MSEGEASMEARFRDGQVVTHVDAPDWHLVVLRTDVWSTPPSVVVCRDVETGGVVAVDERNLELARTT